LSECKPRIGDIWLDDHDEYSFVVNVIKEGYGSGSEDRIDLFVMNSEAAKNGEEDYTHMNSRGFGPGKYMHTLVSRIDNAEEAED
jgi:hypothetical protein